MEAPLLTVGVDQVEVEARLVSGALACPECEGRLSRWGYARPRVVRGAQRRWRLRPRRAWCAGCGTTHVLLPLACLARRADVAVVVGAGLVLAAAGWGHRRVAERIGRPEGTARGWLRRFRASAEPVRVAFTVLLVVLEAQPPVLAPAGSPLGDAVNAVLAVGVAVTARWGPGVGAVSPWEVACAVTGGRLLAPHPTPVAINTSRPW
ncbi:hypothetical protein FDG2_2437 [Candidatus Protofrankia californiensis]|uniref:Uncharacterized protein n=1 Tax=Candidatus Protofrankia californiensis TaxID=1839754 RepID=A0A1C3NXP7_9ACTN|nr:hypothetical protein FDG2_2437 [Candidatus Protofrankia californiensis]